MGYREDDLWRLLAEARDLPSGERQIALVERVVGDADTIGAHRLRFTARMLATHAYHRGGQPAKAVNTFSWCLDEYDRRPGDRGGEDERLLLWQFKYVVGALPAFPDQPLERAYRLVDDMERRYLAGGHSLHAVYRQRWGIAHHAGDVTAAAEWYARWWDAPRDENSDCVGCDAVARVNQLVVTGRGEEALAVAGPVLARDMTCAEQPRSLLTALMLPYLRTGRHDEAVDAHRRGYRLMRGDLASLGSIADHLAFCAATGNCVRGLEIVERHLSWLDRSPSPWATMRFAAAAAGLLDRVGDPVEGPAGELAAPLASRARELAARFDARNGTVRQGREVEELLAASALVEYLPLSAVEGRERTVSRRRSPVAPPTRPRPTDNAGAPVNASGSDGVSRSEGAGGSDGVSCSGGAGGSGSGDDGVPDGGYPDNPTELLDLAERLFREHRTAAAQAAWRAFDRRYPPGAANALLTARRVDARGLVAAGEERPEDAEREWREAAARYADAGDEVRRLVTVSRLGTLLCGDDRTERYDEGFAMVEAATRDLLARGSPDRRVGAELRLAYVLGLGQRPAAALAAVERAAVHLAAVPGPPDRLLAAEVAMRRAQFLLTLGRPVEAVAAAETAREHFAVAGEPPAVALAWLLSAHALADLADHAGAAAAFGAALDRSTEPDVVLSGQHGRGRALLAAGDSAAAVDALVEAVAGFVAAGNDQAAAYARLDLASAYHGCGRALDAAEVAEVALPQLERLGAQEAADRCRYLLSLVYRALDQADEALGLLDQLVTNLDGFDNLPGRSQMHEEAGHILYRADHDAAAARRFGAAADGYRDAGLALDEVRARRWTAVALRWADDLDQAMVTLATAERRVGQLSADEPSITWERAMLALDGARVFIGADRLDDALGRAEMSAAGFRSIGAFTEALQADLLRAELLIRLERPASAEPVLRAVLATAPRRSPMQRGGAWLLGEVLVALGRAEEAAAIRAEYDLDES
jgi:tetratricopeptide (TPR) repeat protein